MTLIFNQSDLDVMPRVSVNCQKHQISDDFDMLEGVPVEIGSGYFCGMTLAPGLWLSFGDCKYNQDLMIKVPPHDHQIQIGIFLSGSIYFDAVHPNLGGPRGYFSGSGISPAYVEKFRGGEHLTTVNIEIEPNWLDSFLVGESWTSDNLKQLFKGEEWKQAFYPTVTPMMRTMAHQLWNAPYRGAAKRMYLQAKAFELLALHLDLLSDYSSQHFSGLKPDTIASLHHAEAILSKQLEHPPLLSDLALQVGVSPRTLQRGFRELFGTTVFGYLRDRRLEESKKLLLSHHIQVSQVALAVGYSHVGHFTKAFKLRFGLTPKQFQISGSHTDD